MTTPREKDLVSGAIVFACILSFITFAITLSSAMDYYRIKAVRSGAAHWIVDDTGRTTFVWNEKEAE